MILFRFFVVLVLLTVGCDDSSVDDSVERRSTQKTIIESEHTDRYNSLTHELGTVRKNIEQAARLYKRLYDAECPFNESLVDKKFSKFSTSQEKALALGRYAALFVYTVSYEQTQNADAYLTELLLISGELGIREVFNESQLKLLYDPNSEIDKSAVLTKAYLKATEQMYSEERALLVSYMVLGGWIQGMKLSYEVCGNYLKDEEVSLSLYDQTYGYYNCIRLLERTKGESSGSEDMLKRLETIKPQIEAMVKSRGNIDEELFKKLKGGVIVLETEINAAD